MKGAPLYCEDSYLWHLSTSLVILSYFCSKILNASIYSTCHGDFSHLLVSAFTLLNHLSISSSSVPCAINTWFMAWNIYVFVILCVARTSPKTWVISFNCQLQDRGKCVWWILFSVTEIAEKNWWIKLGFGLIIYLNRYLRKMDTIQYSCLQRQRTSHQIQLIHLVFWVFIMQQCKLYGAHSPSKMLVTWTACCTWTPPEWNVCVCMYYICVRTLPYTPFSQWWRIGGCYQGQRKCSCWPSPLWCHQGSRCTHKGLWSDAPGQTTKMNTIRYEIISRL